MGILFLSEIGWSDACFAFEITAEGGDIEESHELADFLKAKVGLHSQHHLGIGDDIHPNPVSDIISGFSFDC